MHVWLVRSEWLEVKSVSRQLSTVKSSSIVDGNVSYENKRAAMAGEVSVTAEATIEPADLRP